MMLFESRVFLSIPFLELHFLYKQQKKSTKRGMVKPLLFVIIQIALQLIINDNKQGFSDLYVYSISQAHHEITFIAVTKRILYSNVRYHEQNCSIYYFYLVYSTFLNKHYCSFPRVFLGNLHLNYSIFKGNSYRRSFDLCYLIRLMSYFCESF